MSTPTLTKKVQTIMLSAFERDEDITIPAIDQIRKAFNRQDIVPGVEFEHNGKTWKILDLWDEK